MLLLFRGEDFDAEFYRHAGLDIDNAFFIEDRGRRTLMVPRMNAALAKATFRGRVVTYSNALEDLKRRYRGRTVLYDPYSMSAALSGRLCRFLKLKDDSDALRAKRLKKSPQEAACVAKAARATRAIMDSLDFKAAKTEEGVQKQLLMKTLEMGLEPAFEPIVASGRKTAFPHSRPGKTRIGDLLMIDYGVKYRHYCSDLTRCFFPGRDRKMLGEYERLQDICWFIADSLPTLRTGKEVCRLADELMEKAGFPKMIHSIGHGVGLEVHERPGLGPKSDDALAPSTIAIEPAFYRSGYGLRYEETVYNDGKKFRVL